MTDNGFTTVQDDDGKDVEIPALGSGWHALDGRVHLVTGYIWVDLDGRDPETLVTFIDYETGQNFAEEIEKFKAQHAHTRPGRPTSSSGTLIPGYMIAWLDEHKYTVLPIKEIRPNCAHCGECIEPSSHYMVCDEVWDSVAQSDEVMHLWCLVERLGTDFKGDLLRSDFTKVPINRTLMFVWDTVRRRSD